LPFKHRCLPVEKERGVEGVLAKIRLAHVLLYKRAAAGDALLHRKIAGIGNGGGAKIDADHAQPAPRQWYGIQARPAGHVQERPSLAQPKFWPKPVYLQLPLRPHARRRAVRLVEMLAQHAA
jgi:hypothetical protein